MLITNPGFLKKQDATRYAHVVFKACKRYTSKNSLDFEVSFLYLSIYFFSLSLSFSLPFISCLTEQRSLTTKIFLRERERQEMERKECLILNPSSRIETGLLDAAVLHLKRYLNRQSDLDVQSLRRAKQGLRVQKRDGVRL